jgi:hypothetical protein
VPQGAMLQKRMAVAAQTKKEWLATKEILK